MYVCKYICVCTHICPSTCVCVYQKNIGRSRVSPTVMQFYKYRLRKLGGERPHSCISLILSNLTGFY